MEQNPADMSGMDSAAGPLAAKEYMLGYLSTLKLTEQRVREKEAALRTWLSRVELARSQGRLDLAGEAETEAGRIRSEQERLSAEIDELRSQIAEMRRQLPGQLPLLAARERSVDPDVLEQELLIAAGRLPGTEEQARTERLFGEMEKEAAAEAALAELKAKMAGNK